MRPCTSPAREGANPVPRLEQERIQTIILATLLIMEERYWRTVSASGVDVKRTLGSGRFDSDGTCHCGVYLRRRSGFYRIASAGALVANCCGAGACPVGKRHSRWGALP